MPQTGPCPDRPGRDGRAQPLRGRCVRPSSPARCEREGGDEGLANPRIAVASLERGLFSLRIIPGREVTALATGQAHRSLPVPGLVAREGDVDPHSWPARMMTR